ncbi:MAG: hypothetical protein Q8P45_00220 [Candidatus Harrisonbacteria bacterium]|nr:hypothetical protein [Candidatus Harrisonbacteria bacterium]
MLLYLYGQDSYRKSKKFEELLASFSKKNPQGQIARFSLTKPEGFLALRAFCSSHSLFSEKILAVVSDVEKASAEVRKFLKDLLDEKDKTIIVLSEKKLPKPFAFLLAKPSIAQAFELLPEQEAMAFLKKEAQARSYALGAEEARELIALYGLDFWALTAELEKRSLGSLSREQKQESMDFFPAVSSLASRADIGTRLKTLNYLLEKEEPAAVFNLLAALAPTEEKPKMADYDLAIKNGKLEYPEALLHLVLNR